MPNKAIIIGASGLIGSAVLQEACKNDQIKEIIVLTRRPLKIYNKKIKEIVVNFDQLVSIANEISGDIIFSCLGTTRTKTPDANEYRKIEYDYTVNIAKIALKNQVREFHYISSLGADKFSNSFYLKLKGDVEEELRKLPFTAMHIYQPSYLTGMRTEKRLADKIMNPLMRVLDLLLFGRFSKYKSISATNVGCAMINQSLKNKKGTFIYPSNIIKQLA